MSKKNIQSILLFLFAVTVFFSCAGVSNPSVQFEDTPMQVPQEIIAPSSIYYVDSQAGNDDNEGTILSPWKSLTHINDGTLNAGDRVLFKRGSTFRGQIIVTNGNAQAWTSYGAYGSGDKPLILGSENVSLTTHWSEQSSHIWKSSHSSPYDVGALFVNGLTGLNNKKWFLNDLTAQGDFFYNPEDQHLYLYSQGNPADYYTDIEAALTRHIVDISQSSYAVFEDLHLRFGSAHGFGGGNSSHLIVRGCEMSYIGGGHLDGVGYNSRRYGNGLEFWQQASDHLVENCRIYEIYDTGLTNQSGGAVTRQRNILYRNNIIWNCGLSSFEIWNQNGSSNIENVYFINNSCYNAGSGWGGSRDNRPDKNVFHVALFGNQAPLKDVYIENNIFYSDLSLEGLQYQLLYLDDNYNGYSGSMTVDYNLWYQPADPFMGLIEDSNQMPYNQGEISSYQDLTGFDRHSLFTNPFFSDPGAGDFSLQSDSPVINRGKVQQYRILDMDGKPVNDGPDMGALEY